MLSTTQQMFNYLTNIVPHQTDEFSLKYPIIDIIPNYNALTMSLILNPADYTLLKNSNFNVFTLTNFKNQITIISAEWGLDYSLKITFAEQVSLNLGQNITLNGFDAFINGNWKVYKNDGLTYSLTCDNLSSIYDQPITQIGFFALYTPHKGLNGVKNFTFDDGNSAAVYSIAELDFIYFETALQYDLGGFYGLGYGFLHNWHFNLKIGRSANINEYKNQQNGKNILFVITDDFNIRTNQEKFNNADVSERQDSKTGNVKRLISTYYIDYIRNQSGTAFKSTFEADVKNVYNTLYALEGLPIYTQSPNQTNFIERNFLAMGDIIQAKNESDVIQEMVRFAFTVMFNYGNAYLVNDFSSENWIDNVDIKQRLLF